MGGNAGPIGGPLGPQGAASPGTITPIADVASTPMTICHDKDGRIIPCPSAIAATADEREYWNDYRISGKNTSGVFELISKDFQNLVPFRIQRDGPFQFFMEQYTESTPGDPSTWDYHQPEAGSQVRLVVFPRDDSGSYRFVDGLVDVIHVPGGYNVLIKNIPVEWGDRVELWLYNKSSLQDGKKVYEKYAGFSDTGSSFDQKSFIDFINDPFSFFLGTFRVIDDLSTFEKIGGGTGPHVDSPALDLAPSSPSP